MAKKDKSIRLSPKHGVNPSLDVCFWCGEARGVALVGRIRTKDGDDDAEAPREICTSLEPCEACAKRFAQGVQVVEVTPDGSRFGDNARWAFRPAEQAQPVWPTGRWVVVRPEALRGSYKPGDRVLCSPETMDALLAPEGGCKTEGSQA